MKEVNNWSNVKETTDYVALPAGGYVCEIKKAEVKTHKGKDGASTYDMFETSFDIADGEYKGYFTDNFRAQTNEDKKWKGVLRLYLPTDDGSDKDEWTKSRLKATISAIEESNAGYHWDWNEDKLKGKFVGCLFRNEEWSFNGNTGWKAQPFKFISVEKIKTGKFQIPKDKPLAVDSIASTAATAFSEVVNDDDLPF